jgi:UDP-N-acetylglucosamine 2-epimerase (hydrolysing)
MAIKKNLLFVTGTRADYGKIEPLALAAQASGFSISFFITGMHMMRRYGETRLEVNKFPNAKFYEFVNQRESDPLDFIISKTILGFSDFINEHRPDLVLLHGDRVESLAVSIVCATRYIRSAHIEGGEVSGTIDESIRHCNTKLCNIHFVSSNDAKLRVIALGEPEENIYTIGSPELDVHNEVSGVSIDEVKKYYGINFDDYGIVIFHPVTSESESMGFQAKSLFQSLRSSGKHFVVISPNNDPGAKGIFEVIDTLDSKYFRVIPSMRFKYFSELMKNGSIIIGNSSAGVREAPFIGLPSIDIGSRQNNRAKSPSIFNCNADEHEKIIEKLKNSWGKKMPSTNEFGQGMASENFISALNNPNFWTTNLQKKFSINDNN